MYPIEIIVKNYRCFTEANPLRFTIDKGFTAFIGPNDSGKSAALKFLVEFRNLWTTFMGLGQSSLSGFHVGCEFVKDQRKIFSDFNESPMEVQIQITADGANTIWASS